MSQTDQTIAPERRRDQILAYLSTHDRSSKFGAMSFSAFALPHEIGQIVTDTGVVPSIVAELRERGITVTLV